MQGGQVRVSQLSRSGLPVRYLMSHFRSFLPFFCRSRWCCRPTLTSLVQAVAFVVAATAMKPVHAAGLTVLGLFRDQAVVRLDGKQYVLKVGKDGPPGVKLISANSNQAVIEVNGRRDTYEVGSQITTDYVPPPSGTSVIVAPNSQGMYLTAGTINGYPVTFMVDTGASDIAMNREEARRMGIDYRVDGTPRITQTASGTARAYAVVLKKVTVGNIALNDVNALVVDGNSPAEVLLGGSFLNRLSMKRDGKVLHLIKK